MFYFNPLWKFHKCHKWWIPRNAFSLCTYANWHFRQRATANWESARTMREGENWDREWADVFACFSMRKKLRRKNWFRRSISKQKIAYFGNDCRALASERISRLKTKIWIQTYAQQFFVAPLISGEIRYVFHCFVSETHQDMWLNLQKKAWDSEETRIASKTNFAVLWIIRSCA